MNPHNPESIPPVSPATRARGALMYVLPHHALSWLMRVATRFRLRAWKNWQMRWFIRRYQVDMSLAERPDPESYTHFNDFFTRALLDTARPVCEGDAEVACPADGRVSELGPIDGDSVMQAKGHSYSLTRLLGADAARAAPFMGGHFATIYLSPRDYHRVHMPLDGQLREMVHVPGRLFSVNENSVRTVDGLFARNERVVSVFDTGHGPMALVLVGAVFVGSIETVWAGEVAPASGGTVGSTTYPASGPQAVHLRRGQEMGRFNMGSTVIVVLPPGPLRWADHLVPGAPVTMGERLAELTAG